MFRIIIRSCWISAIAILATPGAGLTDDPAGIDPAKTHALIIGVLHWDNKSYTTYSTDNRWDQHLYDTLAERGVPADNMVLLLDEQATLAEIRSSLAKVAERAKADDTFVFYYAGHGVPSRRGVCFVNYDAGEQEMFAVSEVADILTDHFHGERVLLFADCCYSGGLAQTAETLAENGFDAASVTSAAATNTSTNQWTFTHTLVEALRGNPVADRNGDRRITLSEIATEVADAMRYVEGQQHGQSRFEISDEFVLASVRGEVTTKEVPGPYQLHEYVQFEEDGRWRPARLKGIAEQSLTVEIQDYSTRRRVLASPSSVRKFQFSSNPGQVSNEKPAETLSDDAALAKAKVDGKYETLLKRIRVENDYQAYSGFNDYGQYPATDYAGYTELPAGYWVYVYPHWYIWETNNHDE